MIGRPAKRPPRWLALVVVAAVVVGIALGLWLFGVIT